MKKSVYYFLFIYLTIFLSFNLNGQVIHSNEIEKGTNIQRNASFNVEEIKVRWKKAALENCPGVPCTVTPPAPSFTCGTSTITDIDNNTYNTVLIGTQCWMKTNLKVTKYNNGTLITDSTNSTSSPWAPNSGARTGYDVSIVPLSDYIGTFGYLYNWYAAKGIYTTGIISSTDTLNICPEGWHVPTDSDWNKLVKSIDSGADTLNDTTPIQSTFAGGMLKSNITNTTPGIGLGWDFISGFGMTPGTNISGFSALPGGIRQPPHFLSFSFIRNLTMFWSATEVNSSNAWYRSLDGLSNEIIREFNWTKETGASIRCLKD